jgi:hypothetical protein
MARHEGSTERRSLFRGARPRSAGVATVGGGGHGEPLALLLREAPPPRMAAGAPAPDGGSARALPGQGWARLCRPGASALTILIVAQCLHEAPEVRVQVRRGAPGGVAVDPADEGLPGRTAWSPPSRIGPSARPASGSMSAAICFVRSDSTSNQLPSSRRSRSSRTILRICCCSARSARCSSRTG